MDKPIEKIVEKKIYIEVPVPQSKTKGFEYIKSVVRNGRLYEYYRKKDSDVWEFYTVSHKLDKRHKKHKKCK